MKTLQPPLPQVISFILLFGIGLFFRLINYNDSTFISLLIFINGLVFKRKNSWYYIIGFLVLFIINLTQFNDFKKIIEQLVSILIFPFSLFLIGITLANLLKNKKHIIHSIVIWIYTYALGHLIFSLSPYQNMYFIAGIFGVCYFLSGMYMAYSIEVLKKCYVYFLTPLTSIPILFFTTEEMNYKPLLITLMVFSSSLLGFYSLKFIKRSQN